MYTHRDFSKQEKHVLNKLRKKMSYVEASILKCIPDGRERSIVLSHLEDAALHIGVAIAELGITEEAKED